MDYQDDWPPTTPKGWGDFFLEWKYRYIDYIRRLVEEKKITDVEAKVFRRVSLSIVYQILNRLKDESSSPYEITAKLWELTETTRRVYAALTPDDFSVHALKPEGSLWEHISVLEFTRISKWPELQKPILIRDLRDEATKYLSQNWMHSPYIDWVFVDALICHELIERYQSFMLGSLGFGYTLFGAGIRATAFRTLARLLNFGVGWIFPAWIAWRVYRSQPNLTLIVAAVYYIFCLYLQITSISMILSHKFRTGKSPKRERLDQLLAVEAAYVELRQETIHVPTLCLAISKARDLGISWDAQVLSILDNVAARTPTTWIRRLRDGECL